MPGFSGQPGSRRRGFTLVELVVAGVVAALLAVATAGSLAGILKARARAEARESAYSRAEAAVTRIARDLQSVTRDPDLRHSHVSIRGSGSQSPRDELLMLSRSLSGVRNLDDMAEGGSYEVQYRVVQDRDGAPTLWRRVDPAFDPVMDGGGIAVALARGVVGLRIEASDGAAWFTQWNSDSDGLPHAVRVTVTASDDAGAVSAVARRVVAMDRVPLPPADSEPASSDGQSQGGAR